MDKRRIIEAYQKGILTQEQCAQILGVELAPLGILLGGKRSSRAAAAISGIAAVSHLTVYTRG